MDCGSRFPVQSVFCMRFAPASIFMLARSNRQKKLFHFNFREFLEGSGTFFFYEQHDSDTELWFSLSANSPRQAPRNSNRTHQKLPQRQISLKASQ